MAFQYIGMMVVRIAHWKHSKIKKVSLLHKEVKARIRKVFFLKDFIIKDFKRSRI